MVIVSEDILEWTKTYMRRGGERPVFHVDTLNVNALEKRLDVYFSDAVLQELCMNSIFGKKVVKALQFGYMGHSNGGINGIVDVRESDSVFQSRLTSFLSSTRGREFLREQGVESYDSLTPVKVVAHIPQGKRPIGFLDAKTKKVYLVECGQYKK